MSTAAEVAVAVDALMNTEPGHFPPILTDAASLTADGERAYRAGRSVQEAMNRIEARWSGLPDALEAPGVVEPLHTAMRKPEAMAEALVTTLLAVSNALTTFASSVASSKGEFADILQSCTELRGQARDRAHGDQLAAAAARTARLAQGATQGGQPNWVSSADAPDAPDLTARYHELSGRLASANRHWTKGRNTAITALRTARAGIDPDLLIGSTADTTAGLTAPHAPDRADGLEMGIDWYLGQEHANRVFAGRDEFVTRLQADPTVAHARDVAIAALAAGHGERGVALPQIPQRELGSIGGIGTGVGDLATIAATAEARIAQGLGFPVPSVLTDGRVPGDIDVAFLGSYGLTVVRVRMSAEKGQAVVRFTVTNSTNAASGTRLPTDGLDPLDDQVEAGKNLLGQDLGRGESTQVITWTETLRWRGNRASEGAAR